MINQLLADSCAGVDPGVTRTTMHIKPYMLAIISRRWPIGIICVSERLSLALMN
jgi:hypothetical protein